MAEQPSLQNVLNTLQELTNSYTYSVFIPSLKKEIQFKQLSTEQLKRLYMTTVENNTLNTEFNLVFNNILKENSITTDIDINKLTIHDKVLIYLKTKIECLSPGFTFYLTENEIESNNLQVDSIVCSIDEHFKNVFDKNKTFSGTEFIFENIKVLCNIPTLEVENIFEGQILKLITENPDTTKDLSVIISETFINEIVKYVVKITIDTSEIVMSELSFKDRTKLIEKLPTKIIKDVLQYIEQSKQYINHLLNCNIALDNGVILQKTIPYTAAFFNI